MKEPGKKNLESILSKTEIEDKWWMKEIPAKPYENPETYLYRVLEKVSSDVIIDSISFVNEDNGKEKLEIKWQEAEPFVFDQIKTLLHKIPEQMPAIELQQELRNLKSAIRPMVNPIEEEITDRDQYFKATITDRDFSKEHENKAYPIMRNLFDMRVLNEDHKQVLLKELIHEKNIILLGGGDSINDLIRESELKPASVVNIDPFLNSEDVDKNSRKNYRSIVTRAEDVDLGKKNIQKAHEIWATWSVPLYLENAKDIEQLFNNIDELLLPGGIFRVYPLYILDFQRTGHEAFDKADSFEERRDAWINSVVKLLLTKRYNLTIINHCMMHLQKLSD